MANKVIHLSSRTQDPMMAHASGILNTVLHKVEEGELGENPRCMIIVDSGEKIEVYQAQVTPLEAIGYLTYAGKVLMEIQLDLDFSN